ncbi:homeobox protein LUMINIDEPENDENS [Prosopis cineraria]|uniref:homeobox protein LUMINIDEPENDENS n=1 Tax=Prosopis cineraria TaxID=364024 RepID=UPI00240FD725|nr:homeobox protein LUMINIDEPENDENS [Prosopis cineraria]
MMEGFKDEFSELEIGNSVESFQKFLVSQRELFHSQIDQLQKIVVTQCKLTGVNPLSQEMAAGALSIKIGKRPRDLLNPKAINYMQLVFSIKDAISKKESREISALFGVTVTQVREFFNIQRSRVRRQVRLSRERVLRSNYSEEPCDGFPVNSDSMIPINPAPLNSAGPISADEASCSTLEASFSGLNSSEKHFVDNIFSLMRKEETFSGQVKLLEWILKIQDALVLIWFLDCGGVMILAAWLNEAAVEEQTSVLLLILKVLCHLPLHKALPTHISAILQCVNRLRFHRTPDISNSARVLLSKWSKLLAKNQAIKKTTGVKPGSEAQREMVGQRVHQIMGTGSWNSNVGIPEDVLALSNEGSDDFRKSEAPQTVKLLTASLDDSPKKSVLGVSLSQTRERRKVQLVEQPGQKTVSRSPQAVRVGPVSLGRPMSADDIQKAKLRALFMQSKYGKPGSSKGSKEAKTDGLNKPQTNQGGLGSSSSKVPVSTKTDEDSKPLLLPSKTSNMKDASLESYLRMDLKESFWEKCKQVQILWKTPAEMKLNGTWRVGAGENSKEVDVQKSRNRRGVETIYQTIQEIPSNPNEPWDLEMDYDDTLTPTVPIEQLPDVDGAETPAPANQGIQVTTPSSSNTNSNVAEPDLELLAVLLKNPELVFALTSGQAASIPSEETVKLLDMIKKGSVPLADNTNGNIGGKAQENVEVSLPSPTPSNDPRTSGWTAEVAKNPFSRHTSVPDRGISFPAAVSNMVLPQVPAAAAVAVRQHQTDSLSQAPNVVSALSSVHPNLLTNSPTAQMLSSNIGLSTMMSDKIPACASSVNLSTAHSSLAMRVDSTSIGSNVKPIANLRIQEGLSNSHLQSYELPSPTLTPTLTSSVTPLQRHAHLLQQSHFYEPSSHNPLHSHPPPSMERQGHASESWRLRQDISSSHHSLLNQNTYKASVERSKRSGSSWEQNDYGGGEFESWSPENSPSRNNGHIRGRSFPESRMNPGRDYRPEWSRHRGSSGYWDPGRQGSRKWHEQRR